MELRESEKSSVTRLAILTQYLRVTDGQTNGQTDGQLDTT